MPGTETVLIIEDDRDIADVVALKLAPRAQDSGVSIIVQPKGDLPLVSCDVGLIERVLTNLVENTVRFTPAGGAVRLELDRRDREVRVTVVDTGSGIAAEDLPHVFERFYRADKSRGRRTLLLFPRGGLRCLRRP